MKKNYHQPVMKMVKMQSENVICEVTNVDSNAGINYGGGGKGDARSGSTSIWEEEETGENVEE